MSTLAKINPAVVQISGSDLQPQRMKQIQRSQNPRSGIWDRLHPPRRSSRTSDFDNWPPSISVIMFSFTTNPTINIVFDGQESKPKKAVKVPGQDPLEVPLYSGQDNVAGVVDISLPPGKKVEHQGIRIELIGQTGELCSLFLASRCLTPLLLRQNCISRKAIRPNSLP